MGPHEFSASDVMGRIDQVSPTDLVISGRCHFSNDQGTDVISVEVAVLVGIVNTFPQDDERSPGDIANVDQSRSPVARLAQL